MRRTKRSILEAFERSLTKRDYAAPNGFWSTAYIQPQRSHRTSRQGLFDLIRSLARDGAAMRNQLIVPRATTSSRYGRFLRQRPSLRLDRRRLSSAFEDRQARRTLG